MSPPVLIAALLCLVVLGALGALALGEARAHRLRRRLALPRAGLDRHGAARPDLAWPARLLRAVGRAVRASPLVSAETLRGFEATVAQAGFKGANTVALFIGAKVVLLVLAPALGWLAAQAMGLAGNQALAVAGIAAILGLLGPDWTVNHLRARHARGVQRGLPDALDLMVICAEAGLGLDTAIERVASEMAGTHPAVAREFAALSADMRVLADRRGALVAFGDRTGLDAARRLATTLAQTIQYGTPLAQALRVLAAELRQQRLTQYEERAARLPVLLTMPMIMFILPCVFLVVGGPAVLRAMDAMAR